MTTIKPKHLILNFLLQAEQPTSSQHLVRIAELFDITENHIRVSLARLQAEKLVETCGRGVYGLGPAASKLAEDVNQWRGLEDSLCDWDGTWIAAYIGALGRTDRTALRRRVRILQLSGFQLLETGLMVRPNNLVGGVSRLRDKLYRLGLESEALVFNLADVDTDTEARMLALWDADSLQKLYRKGVVQMREWMATADSLAPNVAARESFLLGDEVLRNIVYDPLLPAEMMDVMARADYLQTMISFDQLGKKIWQQLYQRLSIG